MRMRAQGGGGRPVPSSSPSPGRDGLRRGPGALKARSLVAVESRNPCTRKQKTKTKTIKNAKQERFAKNDDRHTRARVRTVGLSLPLKDDRPEQKTYTGIGKPADQMDMWAGPGSGRGRALLPNARVSSQGSRVAERSSQSKERGL